MAKWSLADGPAFDQNLDDYPRGGKWDILSLTLPDAVGSSDANTPTNFSLQDLVNNWHDENGMCNVFTHASRGKLLHVNRQLEAVKDLRPLDLPSTILSQHAANYHVDTQWIQYQIHSITYHVGQHVESGHYRTVVTLPAPGKEKPWKDYDDSKIPEVVPQLTHVHLCNVTLIWMHREMPLGPSTST